MEITYNNRVLVFDSENKGFINQVHGRQDMHIVYVIDYHTREKFTFFDAFEDRNPAVWLGEVVESTRTGSILDGMKFLAGAKSIVIQNGSGYDFMVFEKIYPEVWGGFDYFERTDDAKFPFRVMDTLVMSQVLNPERKPPYNEIRSLERKGIFVGKVGAHSIASHGIRMNRFKPEHEDWSTLTNPMIHRVEEDVEIGLDFFDYLYSRDTDGCWIQQMATPNQVTKMTIEDAYYCELRVAFSIARQAIRGIRFDTTFAIELLDKMDKELKETEAMFRPQMPKRLCKKALKFSNSQLAAQSKNLSKEDIVTLSKCTHGSEATTIWDITNKPTKRGSKFSSAVQKYFPEMVGYIEDYDKPLVAGAFTPILFEDYPLGNREAVKKVLYKYGWRGVNLNDSEIEHNDEYHELLAKGRTKLAKEWGELPYPWSGKIDEKSIEVWKEKGEVPEWALGIARWYIVNSRRTQILNSGDVENYRLKGEWKSNQGKKECRGLLPKAICQDTGMTAQQYFELHGMFPDTGHWRIPAMAFPCATNTFRMKHRNVVNIPSRGIYGHEMRELFIAAEGMQIVGCDGAGLELRMLSHFMNDAEYTDILLNGDIHTHNQHKAGLPIRDMAKTFIYAFLYGSGVPNLARVCGVTEAKMKDCIEEFKRELPALARLIEGVQSAAEKRKFLVAIDGRRGRVRFKGGRLSVHTALNVLLQMTGSVIMKWAHIIAEDKAVEAGLYTLATFPQLVHMHDESQMEEFLKDQKTMTYTIKASEWKSEEKAEYHDELGQWSAASIVSKSEDTIELKRVFSPLGNIYAQAIKEAGEMFNLRIPTAGEYKVGYNWMDTH